MSAFGSFALIGGVIVIGSIPVWSVLQKSNKELVTGAIWIPFAPRSAG